MCVWSLILRWEGVHGIPLALTGFVVGMYESIRFPWSRKFSITHAHFNRYTGSKVWDEDEEQ